MGLNNGAMYKHVDGSEPYVITDLNAKFKTESGDWITLVLYQPVGQPGTTYARTLPNFQERFKPL